MTTRIKQEIQKPESIANQPNYLLTIVTISIGAAINAALQSGNVLEPLMLMLWVFWVTGFVANMVQKWLKWYTRVKETVTLAVMNDGTSKTSSTEPTASQTSL